MTMIIVLILRVLSFLNKADFDISTQENPQAIKQRAQDLLKARISKETVR